MNGIHVVFPENGGTLVHDDPELVMQGNYVYWHFHRKNPGIAKVKIVFADSAAQFFPNKPAGEKHWCERNIADGNMIWGKAPSYFPSGGPLGSKVDKYTIEAFDANNVLVTSLDPDIRIDGP